MMLLLNFSLYTLFAQIKFYTYLEVKNRIKGLNNEK